MKFIAALALAVAAFAAVRAQEIDDCVIACADGAQEKSDCRQKYVPPLPVALALPLLCPVNPLVLPPSRPPPSPVLTDAQARSQLHLQRGLPRDVRVLLGHQVGKPRRTVPQ